jgi:hypothetical protein
MQLATQVKDRQTRVTGLVPDPASKTVLGCMEWHGVKAWGQTTGRSRVWWIQPCNLTPATSDLP